MISDDGQIMSKVLWKVKSVNLKIWQLDVATKASVPEWDSRMELMEPPSFRTLFSKRQWDVGSATWVGKVTWPKKWTLCLQLFLLIFFTEYLGPVSWHLAPLHKPHHHFHSQPKDHHCQWQQYMWHHHWTFQHCLADPFLVSSHMLQAEQVWDQPCCWGQPKTITTLTSFVIKNLYKRDIKNKFWEQCYLNNITRCCPKIKAISNWIFLNNTKFSFEFTKTYIVAWQLFVCKSPALKQVLSSTHKHSLIYESHNQPSTTFACP